MKKRRRQQRKWKRRKRWIIRTVPTVFVIILVLSLLQRLLMPKYMDDVMEGGMVQEYYDEVKDHDVIFIGDCELYENISPAVLWEEYGINSYIRGSAQQLVWQSYYLLEETLTYEKPEVVVFNVLAMEFNEPQQEAYNRMTLDGMRWSKSKIGCILASMREDEHFIDYVFPLLRYHSRWSQLTEDDFRYFWEKEKVTYNGYYMRVDVKPAVNVPEGRVLADYTFGDYAYKYLDKMTKLCEKSGVELVLVKAPSLHPYWYKEWDAQIQDYAQKHGLKYYNFLDVTEEIGLDFSKDTYDAGLHLNLSGAEKLSRYFGKILTDECGLESRRGEKALEERWEDKIFEYQEERERQTYELEHGEK